MNTSTTSVRKNRSAFSLVELIIVITILGVLSAIGVVSYSSSLLWARDSARVADLDQLKITLKSEKQKTGSYPKPWDAFVIISSGSSNVAAYQGYMNSKVAINDLTKYPEDPLTKRNYPYSTTKNRQAFQIATITEDVNPWKAYVEGDYKTVAKQILPSLVLAMAGAENSQIEISDGITTGGSVGSDNRKKFVLNGGTYNLPYDKDGNPVGNADRSFAEVFTQSGVITTWTSRYRSCLEITEWGAYVWPGEYQVLATDGTVQNVTCP